MSEESVTVKDIAHDVLRDNPQFKLSKADAEHLLKEAFKNILSRVATGHPVAVHKFGTFSAQLFKGRKLKSPLLDGGEIEFKDQLVLRFRQSVRAKQRINQLAADAGIGPNAKTKSDKPAAKGKAKSKGKAKAKGNDGE